MAKTGNLKEGRSVRRVTRHRRIRRKLRGTVERPRLVVFRSLRSMEGQLVDDDASRTILGVSTLSGELREFKSESRTPGIEIAFEAGKLLGQKAREHGVRLVVFDRGGYRYHGRVKAFADGARKGGLEF